MAYGTPKRRRSSIANSDPELKRMVGRKLHVPAHIFPKEKSTTGWAAEVVGVDTVHPGHLNVAFPGWPEEYFFPVSEVKKWLVNEEEDDSEIEELEIELDSPSTEFEEADDLGGPSTRVDHENEAAPSDPQPSPKKKTQHSSKRKATYRSAVPETSVHQVAEQAGTEAAPEAPALVKASEDEAEPRPAKVARAAAADGAALEALEVTQAEEPQAGRDLRGEIIM